jgi:hypothetical protein
MVIQIISIVGAYGNQNDFNHWVHLVTKHRIIWHNV